MKSPWPYSALVVALSCTVSAATRYVDPNSPAPAAPYTNWLTAARTIQNAVDVAGGGDEILVTNGVYATGVRGFVDGSTNRVCVDKALTLRSVNGPLSTIILGAKSAAGGNGEGAARCVYLADGAVLSGFTLTNGATLTQGHFTTGGGVSCESRTATVTNCMILNNSAARSGGGVYQGTLVNCLIAENSCSSEGGGAYGSELHNCLLTGNSAVNAAGAAGGTLVNCTVTGNSAAEYGGGALGGILRNSILYYNTAGIEGANYYVRGPGAFQGEVSYCCTTPAPAGVGNISADPQLASASHLSADSPCRGAGNRAYASGTDIDGEPWGYAPSIGCDEYVAGAVIGELSASIIASYTNIAAGFGVNFTAGIEGKASRSVWSFGDGLTISNQPFVNHHWALPGEYLVTLTAYNENHPEGVSAALKVRVSAAPVIYVAMNSTNPVAPYASWQTAARDIQSAVDVVSVPGALVLVNDGLYNSGGEAVVGTLKNRVAVDKPVTVRSLNGPASTIIAGAKAPDGANGEGAIRGVYLGDGAVLSGFTISNGATRIYTGLNLPLFVEQSGGGVFCASGSALVTNCVLTSNSAAFYGGGGYHGRFENCTFIGNSSFDTGATGASGGGASHAVLEKCYLTANSASDGGGASYCALTKCTLTANTASSGGGAYSSSLYNCCLSANSASTYGGGVASSRLNNCNVTGNSAGWYGGGASCCNLNNCIVFFNRASLQGPNYYADSVNGCDATMLNYCCTTPLPPRGVGNLDLDPQLASASHLSAASPCRNAGSPGYTSGTDIDGEPWANPPSIGCDEWYAGQIFGPLAAAIGASYTNVAVGFPVEFAALITGRTTGSVWDLGDGTRLTNQPFATHSWAAPGDYVVSLRAYNESHPEGIASETIVRVQSVPVHYVSVRSANPVAPYLTWATAARDIQSAVDAAVVPGAWVLVTNGTYATGGRVVGGSISNRVVIDKPLMVQSVKGPANTVIEGSRPANGGNGDSAVRCVYLTQAAVLSGFTLTNGSTRATAGWSNQQRGGGIWCSPWAVITNCLLTGNSADFAAGGAYQGTLINCILTGNWARYGGAAASATLNRCSLTDNFGEIEGGGVYDAVLNSCVLMRNSSSVGGGAALGTLNNCTVTGNLAANYGAGAWSSTINNSIVYFNTNNSAESIAAANTSSCALNHCCTTPLPFRGLGNFTNFALLVNRLGGDLHLQSNSPCINAGANAYVSTSTDRDGNPRIVGSTVDVGAYEFQSPASSISLAWLQHYGLRLDGSADHLDADRDGMNNWQEWIADTNPTNSSSGFRMLTPSIDPPFVTLTWQSSSNRLYFLERAVTLMPQPTFSSLISNIPGDFPVTSFTDTNAFLPGPALYRVGVQTPDL